MIFAGSPALNIPDEVRRAHRSLGSASEEFLAYVERTPEALRRTSFEAVHRQGFYPLTSWPILAGTKKLAEMKEAAVELTRLIKKVPGLVFRGNLEAMASFYGVGSAAFLTMVLEEPNGIESALARADLVESDAGLKILELNLGPPGGMQVPANEANFRNTPVLRTFFEAQSQPIRCTNTLEVLMTHIVSDILARLSWQSPQLNLGFVTEDEFPPGAREAIEERMDGIFAAVLARLAPSYTGQVILGSFHALEERPDGVWLRGQRLAGIVELMVTHWNATFRSVKARRVAAYNGPGSLILDDKRNLALLSELQASPLLASEDRERVRRWVPWCRQVKPGYTSRDGERFNLAEYVSSHRESLVLKPARSAHGDNVHLGPSTAPETWSRVLREALSRRDWIVQEYHQSRPYLCRYGEDGCAVHDMIWGIFVFGSQYGGGFLRVMPRWKVEPINAAKGAEEGILFEVEES